MAQHGVGLAQRFDNARQLGPRQTQAFGRAACVSSPPCGRNSCSGGSSRRIVTGSPSIASKIPSKSARCIGSSLASARRRPPSSRATIISRIAVIRSPSKNMCSVRQSPMPSAPKPRAMRASCGRVGVRADLEACAPRRPTPSSRANAWYAGAFAARPHPADDLHDLARRRRQVAAIDLARRAVERDPVAFRAPSSPSTSKRAVLDVDRDRPCSRRRRTCPCRARRRPRGSSCRRAPSAPRAPRRCRESPPASSRRGRESPLARARRAARRRRGRTPRRRSRRRDSRAARSQSGVARTPGSMTGCSSWSS